MSKLRTFPIALLLIVMLFNAVSDRGFRPTLSNSSSEASLFEAFDPEFEKSQYLTNFLEMDLGPLCSIADSEITFDLIYSIKNFTLPQLLGSHRIALPPPFLV